VVRQLILGHEVICKILLEIGRHEDIRVRLLRDTVTGFA
jgi:hypothetical protein